MKEKDAAVIKVLADIGAIDEPELTPEQEELLKRALDPEEQFLHDIKRLYVNEDAWDDAERRRTTPNPLPIAGHAELNRAFDLAEELDDKILANYKKQHGIQKFDDLRQMGKVLKSERPKYGKVETVPISNIIASEDVLDGEHLKALVNGKDTTPASGQATLLKVGNKFYVQDGNHRFAAAFLRGEKTIDALVLEV